MRLTRLYRHPIKSLGSEALEQVTLTPGAAMPGDRMLAFAHGKSQFDPDQPTWVPRANFLNIANAPALAAVEIRYDEAASTVHLDHELTGPMTVPYGSETDSAATPDALSAWLSALAEKTLPGPYHLAIVPGVALADSPLQAVSIMSERSLSSLSAREGVPLDARRFRGNLWIDSDALEPFAELDWEGRELRIGGVRLRVVEPIERCLATAANPDTGDRDAMPTQSLKRGFGHCLFGMLAKVVEGGVVSVGDPVELI